MKKQKRSAMIERLFVLIGLWLFVAMGMTGCQENVATDRFGVKYTDYPICGKSYKTTGNYKDGAQIWRFYSNGECDTEFYDDDGSYSHTIDDFIYWMEKDSIFIAYDYSPRFKHKRGICKASYIQLSGVMLMRTEE